MKERDEADKLEVFHQVLLSKGLVKEVKNPPVPDAIERQLIEVKGKPVSQTIIEERNRLVICCRTVVVLLQSLRQCTNWLRMKKKLSNSGQFKLNPLQEQIYTRPNIRGVAIAGISVSPECSLETRILQNLRHIYQKMVNCHLKAKGFQLNSRIPSSIEKTEPLRMNRVDEPVRAVDSFMVYAALMRCSSQNACEVQVPSL